MLVKLLDSFFGEGGVGLGMSCCRRCQASIRSSLSSSLLSSMSTELEMSAVDTVGIKVGAADGGQFYMFTNNTLNLSL